MTLTAEDVGETVERAYEQYQGRDSSLSKNTFLTALKDQNQVLYYHLVQTHLKEMFPIIYTPTEGEAIQQFSKIFRRPEGIFLNIEEPERVAESLGKWAKPEDVDVVVVSDGEQILGMLFQSWIQLNTC